MDDHGRLDPGTFTDLLKQVVEGNYDAKRRLMELTYAELRPLAQRLMQNERLGHTLSATGLVHELWLKLDRAQLDAQSRTAFFAVAADMMRKILVDHARRHRAAKRTPDQTSQALRPGGLANELSLDDILDIDALVDRLATEERLQADIVKLRFFGGLTLKEAADVLAVSVATIKREWTLARAWLRRRLEQARTQRTQTQV